MPHIGPTELIIILAIILIIFGVGRLPEIGSAMGRAIRGFRRETTSEEESASTKKESKEGE
jgi:sec-independent protein translocase protein TatA